MSGTDLAKSLSKSVKNLYNTIDLLKTNYGESLLTDTLEMCANNIDNLAKNEKDKEKK